MAKKMPLNRIMPSFLFTSHKIEVMTKGEKSVSGF